MANINRVLLAGNLTRDPEVRYIPSGTAVAEIGLAVNRYFYDKQANERKEETTFVDVTLWGRQAELAGEYLSKGRPVFIEGRLQLDQWQDKTTGQNRSKLKVVAEQMQFLGGRGDDAGTGGAPRGGGRRGGQGRGGSPAPQDSYDAGQSSPADSFYEGAGDIPDDDVPF